MGEANELITIFPDVKSGAEHLGIQHLRMAVWYNDQSPLDRAFGEALFRCMEQIGCITESEQRPLSPEAIMPGQQAKNVALGLFRNADIVHVIVSRQAFEKQSQSYWPGIKAANEMSDEKPEGKMFIIPIVLDDSPLPASLAHLRPLKLAETDSLNEAGKIMLKTWQAVAAQYPNR